MKKNFKLILAGFILLASCNKQASTDPSSALLNDPQPLSALQIDEIIQKSLQNQQTRFMP
jgi:hypothetical protein